ncbi:hypothetical protein Glove_52g9 [Diversispora epigaea]|uniref:TLDc domain-containing protein n=1 Tax=Diversispora epigaea TaxID=1348612 RepID=A0A397JDF6_9GLOM|nr:hypothetical protein Glove_52g9 [Diversispora epigaea]
MKISRLCYNNVYHLSDISIFLSFEPGDFTSLQETALISILKRDDLNVEEIKIWDNVITWGIAQNPFTPVSPTDFSPPLGGEKFVGDTGEDIWEKVKPYEKILEKQLCDDMIQHNITISTPRLSSRVNEPFSIIINKEHVAELSSWIDRKSTTYSLENIPYEFQLILKGSRDGFHFKTFWDMCHGHASTIVVVKVAETDEVIIL